MKSVSKLIIGAAAVLIAIGGYLYFVDLRNRDNDPQRSAMEESREGVKIFDSIKDGGYKPQYHFTLEYPASWSHKTDKIDYPYPGPQEQTTMFADWNNTRGINETPGPVPKEFCWLTAKIDYTKNPAKPAFHSENSYSDPAERQACNDAVAKIEASLVTDFMPFMAEKIALNGILETSMFKGQKIYDVIPLVPAAAEKIQILITEATELVGIQDLPLPGQMPVRITGVLKTFDVVEAYKLEKLVDLAPQKQGVVHIKYVTENIPSPQFPVTNFFNHACAYFESWHDLETGDEKIDATQWLASVDPCRRVINITDGESGDKLALYPDPKERRAKWINRCQEYGLSAPKPAAPVEFFHDRITSGQYKLTDTSTLDGKNVYVLRQNEGPLSVGYRILYVDAETLFPLVSEYFTNALARRDKYVTAEILPREDLPADFFEQKIPEGYILEDPCMD